MKKISYILFIFCFSLVVVACQNENNSALSKDSEEIDEKSLDNILGAWMSEDRTIYTIDQKDKNLLINHELYEVIKANNKDISIQKIEEPIIYYTFKFEEEKVMLLETHQVKKGYRGGEMAPKKVKKIITKKIDYSEDVFQEEMKTMVSLYEQSEPFCFLITEQTIEGEPIITEISFNQLELSVLKGSTVDKLGSQEKLKSQYKKMSIDGKEVTISEPVEDKSEKQEELKIIFPLSN